MMMMMRLGILSFVNWTNSMHKSASICIQYTRKQTREREMKFRCAYLWYDMMYMSIAISSHLLITDYFFCSTVYASNQSQSFGTFIIMSFFSNHISHFYVPCMKISCNVYTHLWESRKMEEKTGRIELGASVHFARHFSTKFIWWILKSGVLMLNEIQMSGVEWNKSLSHSQ